MKCRRCGSEDVVVQQVAITKTKGKGITYWLFWIWYDIILWVFLFLPRLLISLFKSKKIETKMKKMATCQSCGNSWQMRF